MKVPSDLKYTKDHEWVRIEEKIATVGVTDYAQSELGDIVYIDIDTIDEELEVGEAFGTIEAVKTVSDLFMPVNGKVIEFNSALDDAPELVNTDPFGEGWMVKIEISSLSDELMDAEAYQAQLAG